MLSSGYILGNFGEKGCFSKFEKLNLAINCILPFFVFILPGLILIKKFKIIKLKRRRKINKEIQKIKNKDSTEDHSQERNI